MLQPLVFLALFGPLLVGSLGGEANNALGESVWQWFVPSILVMTALFGTTTVGANLLYEFHTGAHERMLVTPLSRPSLLIGRALKEMVPLAGQAVIIVLVMIPFGFVLYPAGALLGLALLAVFGVGLGSLSYALAIAVRKQEWMFWAVQQTLIFPLMILSGMLLPLETGPEWMQLVAKFNPLAYIVDAERALFGGQIATSAAMWGAVAAIGTADRRSLGGHLRHAPQRRLISAAAREDGQDAERPGAQLMSTRPLALIDQAAPRPWLSPPPPSSANVPSGPAGSGSRYRGAPGTFLPGTPLTDSVEYANVSIAKAIRSLFTSSACRASASPATFG